MSVARWLGGAVGVGDGQGAVGGQDQVPAVVVNGVVVSDTQGQQVGEVGGAAVFPPDDVVEVAEVVAGVAAGDGAGGVEGAQGAALGPVGHPGGAAQVEAAGGVEHDAAAHDDRVDVGGVEQAAQHLGGQLDREPPVDGRGPVGLRVGDVEDGDDLGHGAASAVSLGERGEGVGAEERLAFEGVEGAVVGGLVGEQGGDGVGQAAVEGEAGLGIEPAPQAPHPLVVDPRVQPGGPPLPCQTAHPVVGAELVHLDRQRLVQLGRRRGRGRA